MSECIIRTNSFLSKECSTKCLLQAMLTPMANMQMSDTPTPIPISSSKNSPSPPPPPHLLQLLHQRPVQLLTPRPLLPHPLHPHHRNHHPPHRPQLRRPFTNGTVRRNAHILQEAQICLITNASVSLLILTQYPNHTVHSPSIIHRHLH